MNPDFYETGNRMIFKLTSEYIELIKLLKANGIAQSGAHAKLMVEEGIVKRNGSVEYRKRAKIRTGEVIEVDGITISVE